MGKSALPEVAAAASWMEAAQLPLRELRRKYTKSEMAIAGWRSLETASNMRQQTIAPAQQSQIPPSAQDAIERDLEEKIGDFAEQLVNEKGEIDLRRVTGAQAVRFMNAIGCASRRRTAGD